MSEHVDYTAVLAQLKADLLAAQKRCADIESAITGLDAVIRTAARPSEETR